MSYYKAICPTVAGFAGQSDVRGEISWPFDWSDSADMPAEYGPLGFTRSRAIELFWRMRELDFTLTLSDTSYDYAVSGTFTRSDDQGGLAQVTDEAQLRRPGISETFGGNGVNGPFWYTANVIQNDQPIAGGTVALGMQMDVFRKHPFSPTPSTIIPHMAYDSLNQLWIPEFHITGVLEVSTGLTWKHEFYSTTWELGASPLVVFDTAFLSSHGGGNITTNAYSIPGSGGARPDVTAATMTIDPSRWFRWGNKWDENTGNRVVIPA